MLAHLNYRPRGSVIEKIDPRARWIYSLILLFTITLFWDVRFLLFFLVLVVIQYALTNLTWRETRRAWLFIFFIIFMMVVVNTLITSSGTLGNIMEGGRPVFGFDWPLPFFGWHIAFSLTVERLWFALSQVIRILSISGLFITIPFTMDPRMYGATFRGMGVPDRLAYSMDLAFRFLPTLTRDFNITIDSQRARGYELERGGGGAIAQLRKMAPLIVPVTMNAILNGEDIINAMDLRCFGLRARTWIQQLCYQKLDVLLIGLAVAILIASLILRFVFHLGEFWVPPFLLA